jgi:hypothetical protein
VPRTGKATDSRSIAKSFATRLFLLRDFTQ